MSDEIKACPFCKTKPKKYAVAGKVYAYGCANSSCGIYDRPIPVEQWQSRPEQARPELPFCLYNKNEQCPTPFLCDDCDDKPKESQDE